MSFRLKMIEDELEPALKFSDDETLRASFDSHIEVAELDYTKLFNKPSINNVELVGEKTGEELYLQDKMDELTNSDIEALLS